MTQRGKNLLILGLMIAPFIVTMVVVRLFVDLEEMDRVNKGTLIIPHVDLLDLAPIDTDGRAVTREDLAGRWTLMYISDGSCDTGCRNALFYLITQLRKSLDADAPRVRRLVAYAAPPEESLRSFLDHEVAGMEEMSIDATALAARLTPVVAPEGSATDHIYLVSPDGMIFLWYPTHDDIEKVLLEAENIRADLTRTLKGSLVG